MNTINDRIQIIVNELFEGNKAKFARAINVSQMHVQGILGVKKSEPSYGFIQKLVIGLPKIDPLWIIHGEGSMYIEGNKANEPPPPDYGFDVGKVLAGYVSQQETIHRLTVELERANEIIKAKQEIIDDMRIQIGGLNTDLRFRDKSLKAKSTIPANGGDQKQAG